MRVHISNKLCILGAWKIPPSSLPSSLPRPFSGVVEIRVDTVNYAKEEEFWGDMHVRCRVYM